MAKENRAFFRGIVAQAPKITKNANGEFAVVIINVGRPERPTGDGTDYMKVDNPMIMTRNKAIIEEMSTWKKNDIVGIEGVLCSRMIMKTSYCSHCRHKNSYRGSLVYVNPIFVEKLGSVEDEKMAQRYLLNHREISNRFQSFGKLLNEPKKLQTMSGIVFTQYQIAMRRKFRIQEDSPEIKTDYPWVKSYGDNAEMDQYRLQRSSEIYIDGCIQARNVSRKVYCGQQTNEKGEYLRIDGHPVIAVNPETGEFVGCGKEYIWSDKAFEIVPFATEYIENILTVEEAEKRANDRAEQSRKDKAQSLLYAQTQNTSANDSELDTDDSANA